MCKSEQRSGLPSVLWFLLCVFGGMCLVAVLILFFGLASVLTFGWLV